jgi:hypothetical protein
VLRPYTCLRDEVNVSATKRKSGAKNKKEAKTEFLPPGVVGWYWQTLDGLQPALPGRLAASLA